MKNVTTFKILNSAEEVFEAFVDPKKIGNFWFSSSSERWEQGKTITLRYDEYDTQGDIKIIEIEPNKKIVFEDEEQHVITIIVNEVNPSETLIEITEEGFNENDPNLINRLIDC